MFKSFTVILALLIASGLPAEAQEINKSIELRENIEIKAVVDEILESEAIEFNNSIVVDPMPKVKCSDGTSVEITECIGEVRHQRKNKIVNFIAPGRREWVYDTLDGRKVRSKKEFQLVLDNRTAEQKHPRWMLGLRAIMATVAAGTLAF